MQSRSIKLATNQIEQAANILADIGTVTAASTIIPSLLSDFNLFQMTLGIIGSLLFWFLSIKLHSLWNQ